MTGEPVLVPLSQVARITSGKRPPIVSKEKTPDLKVPVIGGGGPSGFTTVGLHYEPILITGRVGTLGKLITPTGSCWPSDNALVIQPQTQETDFGFLRYSLQMVIAETAGMNRGAANPLITQGDLGRLMIAHPPLPTQRAIAHILGTLDDKIELNRRMNATLEAMARALFQSWFVDFDPVRRNKDEGGRTKDEISALFPDSFQESELGQIPSDWRVMKFGEFIERLSVGQKYEQKTVSPVGKVPVLDQGKSGVIGFHNTEPGVTATLKKPVAVFANHTCYMRLITYSFSAIQNVLPFVGSGVDTLWAYYATEGRLSFSEYKGHWPDFVIQESVVPPRELTDAFGRLAQPLIAQMRNNEEESRTLATLRDTLLPKLLSGELSVSNLQ